LGENDRVDKEDPQVTKNKMKENKKGDTTRVTRGGKKKIGLKWWCEGGGGGERQGCGGLGGKQCQDGMGE